MSAWGDDDRERTHQRFATPLVVANAAGACAALNGKTIDSSSIGEPTRGAVVTSATYHAAVPDAPNATNTAIIPGTPDYCQTLIDIKPVDVTAPVIKAEVNLPASWNGKSLQMGGGGLNGTLVTGLTGAAPEGGFGTPTSPLPVTSAL